MRLFVLVVFGLALFLLLVFLLKERNQFEDQSHLFVSVHESSADSTKFASRLYELELQLEKFNQTFIRSFDEFKGWKDEIQKFKKETNLKSQVNHLLEKRLADLEVLVGQFKKPVSPKILDDFTSCINYESTIVNSVNFEKNDDPKKFEFVRLGISDFCVPDTTDVSVFFTWQSASTGNKDCLNERRSQVSVRFKSTSGMNKDTVFETKAQMVGCFQDDQARSWRYFAARLSRLAPQSKYTYAIQGENFERTFSAPPLPGNEKSPTTLVLLGDTQVPGADALFSLLDNSLDLIVHVGDGTYGTNNGECYGEQHTKVADSPCGWNCVGVDCRAASRMTGGVLNRIRTWTDNFDAHFKGQVAYMSTMGNHDNDLQWFLTLRPPCSSALPGVEVDDVVYSTQEELNVFAHSTLSMKEIYSKALDRMKSPHFFSFDYGLIHIISLGSEDNPMNAYESFDGQLPLTSELMERFELHFGKQSRQYKWLIKDLSRLDRSQTPWVLLYTHRPLYHTAAHHPNCGVGGDWFVCMFRDLYEPVLRQFGVDLVVSGHSHHYQRTKPLYKDRVDWERGVVHVVIGTGGFEVTGNRFSGRPEWLASRQGDAFGLVKFRVENKTHAHWTHQLASGQVYDQTWLVRRV